MATITNRQQFIGSVLGILKKQYPVPETRLKLSVLEQLIFAICREGTTHAKAEPAFKRLQEDYFDWNEVRVSSPHEVAETLSNLPDPLRRADRIIGLLQQIFEDIYSFDLDSLYKKGLKDAARQLRRYEQINDFHLAWVIQHSLGGHAIPLDVDTVRLLNRLGVLEGDLDNIESLRATLEHIVPKARGSASVELLSEVAHDVCLTGSPRCTACPLTKECVTGQHMASSNGESSHNKSRPKPR